MRFAISLAALVAASVPSFAGQALFTATGTVGSASVGSGPFVGTTVGAPVTVSFIVNTPGTPVSAGMVNYPVDVPSFLITIGTNSTTLNTASTVCGFRNADPVVDGIFMGSAPLVGGGQLSFSFSDCNGAMFTSLDPVLNVGSWSGFFYCVYSFAVQGPGVFIDIDLQSFSIALPSTGTPGCFGDGSGTACPCGNNSSVGAASGCLSSLALGGRLLAHGTASVSGDTLTLDSSNVPNGPGLFFQGTTVGGSGIAFGDGLLCSSGTITRLGVVFATGNASTYPGGTTPGPISVGGLVAPGDVRSYQLWYRDGDPTFCTSATFNLTNEVSLTWGS